jgi:hypothetical protein
MFTKTKTALFALAAIAAVGIASVATSSTADARGFAGGGFSRGGGGHIGHVGGGARIGGGVKLGGGVHIGHRPGIGIKVVGQGRPCRYAGCGITRIPRPHWCRWTGRCHIHVRWPRPVIYGVGAVATSYAVAPAVAAPARPCTCLTKEYTPDNLVVFKDVCTKEVASAPIGNTQVQLQLPAQEQQPQAPAQQ